MAASKLSSKYNRNSSRTLVQLHLQTSIAFNTAFGRGGGPISSLTPRWNRAVNFLAWDLHTGDFQALTEDYVAKLNADIEKHLENLYQEGWEVYASGGLTGLLVE